MANPRNWEVLTRDGSNNPDAVRNTDTGEDGRAYFGMGGYVGEVRDAEGNDKGSIDASGD